MEANYFTILWGFCHMLTWISHRCTCVPHPEPPCYLSPHPIPLCISFAIIICKIIMLFYSSILHNSWIFPSIFSYLSLIIFRNYMDISVKIIWNKLSLSWQVWTRKGQTGGWVHSMGVTQKMLLGQSRKLQMEKFLK